MNPVRVLFFVFALIAQGGAWAADDMVNPRVVIHTNMGDITVELDAKNAPITVENFLAYVDDDGYANTIFHRVIPGFMIQSGGHFENLEMLEEKDPIYNEAENGLKNVTGTIAMARMSEIDSAARQWFINVVDNTRLDHHPESCTREDQAKQEELAERGLFKPVTCKNYGYAVFGKVVDGMDVVHAIEIVETEPRQDHLNVPVEPVVISRIERLK